MPVIGVDGCPGGWVAVEWDGGLAYRVHASFRELLASYPDAACIGIDVPIGLDDRPRDCDVAARRVLGPGRASCVFRPPSRAALGTSAPDGCGWLPPDYRTACALNRQACGVGLSKQAYGILPKIAEVDAAMTPDLQGRIIEVHPEVAFWALAKRAMHHTKKSAEGFEERRTVLTAAFVDVPIPTRTEARRVARPAGPDDVLDAIVAAWTARRFATGTAGTMPQAPTLDDRGLRMQIVY
jgi:predicted RNase H-like nuclease